MPTLKHFTVVPRLPAALERLRDIAYNLWWSWSPVAHELFVRLDPDLWEAVRGNPIELLARVDQARLEELAGRRRLHEPPRRRVDHLPALHAARGVVLQDLPRGRRRAHRLLLDGVRPARVPAHLLGGPGRPGRRPPQDGERPRSAAGRRGPRVRRGVLPPGAQRRRLAGRALPDQRLAPHARPARARRHRQAARSSACSTRTASSSRSSGRCRSAACRCYCSTRTSRRTRPADRSITGPALRRRPGVSRPAGDHAGHRWRPRPRGGRSIADGVPHERGALGVPRRRAHRARHARARRAVRGRGRGQQRRQHLHHPHPGSRGQRRLRPDARPALPRAVPRRARDRGGRAAGARARGRRATTSPPFSMPVLAMRAADHYNGVSELHGEVSRKMWQGLWPDLPHHEIPIDFITNGVHTPSWVAGRDGRALHALPRSALGRAARRRGALGSAPTRSPTPSSGRFTSTAGTASCSTRVAGCARGGRAPAGRARRSSRWPTRCSIPQALTIGFARRFATYKRAGAALFSDLERVK